MNSTNGRPQKNWASFLTILGLIGLVGIPILVYGCQDEMSSWRMAGLAVQRENGDRQQAVESAQRLLERNPENLPIARLLAEWLIEDGRQSEAAELCEDLAAKGLVDVRLVIQQINALAQLGKYDRALKLIKENNSRIPVIYLGNNWSAERKNQLAYARAFAEVELPTAFKDIDAILAAMTFGWREEYSTEIQNVPRAYLLSAIIYIEAGKFEAAVEVLTEAISYTTELLAAINRHESVFLADEILLQADAAAPHKISPAAAHMNQALAILYACRAKAYQELGQVEQHESDLRRVLEEKLDPQQLLHKLPDGKLAGDYLRGLTACMDTRACVLHAAVQYHDALRDANAVVAGARAMIVAVEHFKYYEKAEEMPLESDYIEFVEEWPKKTLATLLFHRSMINDALGNPELVVRDYAEIRELGFEPGLEIKW